MKLKLIENIINWLQTTMKGVNVSMTYEANEDELEAWEMKDKNIIYFEVVWHQGWCVADNNLYIYVEVINDKEYRIIGMSEVNE